MPRLLFEIGTEELPAWYVAPAAAALAEGVVERLAALHVAHGAVETAATPRRLALSIADVAERSATRVDVRRGPSAAAAFDAAGAPTRAAIGFAASVGVPVSALKVQEGPKGRYLIARQEVGGEATALLLPDALAAVAAALPAPRKMRWGDVDAAFVRPIAWLTALWDDAVLPVAYAGLQADRLTYGHRFAHPGAIVLRDAGDYDAALTNAAVIAPRARRRAAVVAEIDRVAAAAGGVSAAPAALLEEIVDLLEEPHALMGRIDDAFLALPDAVLGTVMIHHQRFVPVRGSDGRLLPRFVAVANQAFADPAVVVGGYERVLAGRLYDARFFWDADRTKSLAQHAWGLSGVAFARDLGSMADKVARVEVGATAIARRLGFGEGECDTLARALPLLRADLVTEMVGELPELEGTMARAYALADGLDPAAASALEDAVMPRGPHDALPGSRVGAVLSVADRLDKLLGFFALGKRPTGSADPFALRRDAVALNRVLVQAAWRVPLESLIGDAAQGYAAGPVDARAAAADVAAFVWDRLAATLAEEGIATNTIRAAIAGSRSVVAAARRAHLLRDLTELPSFATLLTLYKRAANLAEQAVAVDVDPAAFVDDVERDLLAALQVARAGVDVLLETMHAQLPGWDLGRGPSGRLRDAATLSAPVLALEAPLEAFFRGVLVMVDDVALRQNRLALLAQVAAVLRSLGALEHLGA
jgi:glycyl-tRNA synthetase beta chain